MGSEYIRDFQTHRPSQVRPDFQSSGDAGPPSQPQSVLLQTSMRRQTYERRQRHPRDLASGATMHSLLLSRKEMTERTGRRSYQGRSPDCWFLLEDANKLSCVKQQACSACTSYIPIQTSTPHLRLLPTSHWTQCDQEINTCPSSRNLATYSTCPLGQQDFLLPVPGGPPRLSTYRRRRRLLRFVCRLRHMLAEILVIVPSCLHRIL